MTDSNIPMPTDSVIPAPGPSAYRVVRVELLAYDLVPKGEESESDVTNVHGRRVRPSPTGRTESHLCVEWHPADIVQDGPERTSRPISGPLETLEDLQEWHARYPEHRDLGPIPRDLAPAWAAPVMDRLRDDARVADMERRVNYVDLRVSGLDADALAHPDTWAWEGRGVRSESQWLGSCGMVVVRDGAVARVHACPTRELYDAILAAAAA